MAKIARGVAVVASIVALVPGPWQGPAAAIATIASVAATALAKKPGGSVTGNPTQFKIDLNAGIPYAIGRTWSGGYANHRAAYAPKLSHESFSIIWSLGPVEAIEGFYANRDLVAFSGNAATGYYSGFMWLDKQLGACPEADALTAPIADFPQWGPAYKLSGYAAGLLTFKFDTKGKNVVNNRPTPGAVGKWVKVYDPRLDSTYPGGSGPHRAMNEATYTWSENPWLHALTYALGRFQNGRKVIGPGIPIRGIDVASYVEAANVADANGWKVGGVVSSADDKWQVLKMMAQAGGGEPMRLAAQLSCWVSAPRVSIATIKADDLAGPISVTGYRSRRDRFNTVIPKRRSEQHGWEVIPDDSVSIGIHVAEDGGMRSREIDHVLVQEKDQNAELAAYAILNAREIGPIILPLKPAWIAYKPGDCVNVDLPETRLLNRPCVIRRRNIDPQTGIVTFELETETTAKHAFALGRTGVSPPTPALGAPDYDAIADNGVVESQVSLFIANSSVRYFPVLMASSDGTITVNDHERVYADRIVAVTGSSLAVIAGPPPAASSRYWRLEGNGGGRGFWVITELQMRGAAGGSDLTTGKTVSASSAIPTASDAGINYTGPAGATDDDLATGWHSSSGSSHTFSVDFGSPVSIGEFVITSKPNNTTHNDQPTVLSLQHSDDGINWTTVHTNDAVPPFGNSETRTFTLPAVGDEGENRTWMVCYDDAARTGGMVNYVATQNAVIAYNTPEYPARHFVGYVTIPTTGTSEGGGAGPAGSGGGGGSVLPRLQNDNPEP